MSPDEDPVITCIAVLDEHFDLEELYALEDDVRRRRSRPAPKQHPGISYGARNALKRRFAGELSPLADTRRHLFRLVLDAGNLLRCLATMNLGSSWFAYALTAH